MKVQFNGCEIGKVVVNQVQSIDNFSEEVEVDEVVEPVVVDEIVNEGDPNIAEYR